MRRALQLFALILVLIVAGFWLATGANRGWTKTREPVRFVDEVTGLEGIRYQHRFVPGVDFLGAALLGAAVLAAASLLCRRIPTSSVES